MSLPSGGHMENLNPRIGNVNLKLIKRNNMEKNKKFFITSEQDISDGYHTFSELYDYRKIYNALLFNEWAKQGKFNVHKSIRHSDGELCFGGGWFVVVAILPTGQITNHYELKDWELFSIPEEYNAKFEYDGHTPEEAKNRMLKFLRTK